MQDLGGEHGPTLLDGRPVYHPRARRLGDDGRQAGRRHHHFGQDSVGIIRRLGVGGQGKSTAAAVAWRMDRVMVRDSVGPALALRGGR